MSRMLATKTSLSVRVDALSDADAKSSPSAPSVGIEYRAMLESRLRALEHRSDLNPGFSTGSSGPKGRQQPKFEMNGAKSKQYNTAADSVMLPTQRVGGDDDDEDISMSPVAKALESVMEVKEERKKRKEEKRAEKEAKKEKKKAKEAAAEAMEVDGGDEDEEAAKKEKKRLKKEKKAAEAAAAAAASEGKKSSSKKRHSDTEEEPPKKKKKKSSD